MRNLVPALVLLAGWSFAPGLYAVQHRHGQQQPASPEKTDSCPMMATAAEAVVSLETVLGQVRLAATASDEATRVLALVRAQDELQKVIDTLRSVREEEACPMMGKGAAAKQGASSAEEEPSGHHGRTSMCGHRGH